MNTTDLILKRIIPEKILDCKFKEMPFTMEMLEVYLAVNGEKSLLELSRQLSIDVAKLIIYIKKMTQTGIVKVQDTNSPDPHAKEKYRRQFCYRGVVHYK